ncbi:MAG: hypothetical protein AB7V62_15960 [Thermoleophilia bacterium]
MPDPGDRVRDALGGLRGPDRASTERARRAALAALGASRRPPRRGRWALAAAGAAAAVVVVAGAAALAATDRLGVRIGREDPAPPAAPVPPTATAAGRVVLPPEARGLAVVAGGRMWLGTAAGVGVQGLPVESAELSPNARFVAVGLGDSLVALAPDGRRAWSHPAGGRVVAAAWAPNPIAIAYLVRRGVRNELRVIEGDGDGDRLVDPDVAPVRPSWRADTGALAYADAGGDRVVVASYPSLRRRAPLPAPDGVGALAFAPSGGGLAATGATTRGAVATGTAERLTWVPFAPGTLLSGVAWDGDGRVVVAGTDERRGVGRLWTVVAGPRGPGKPLGTAHGDPVAALARFGTGTFAVALREGDGFTVWEVAAPPTGADEALAPRRPIVRIPGAGPGAALTAR